MRQGTLFDQAPPTGRANPTVAAEDVPRTDSLRAAVLAHMQERGSATSGELLHVGGMRFGARIHELKAVGYRFDRKRLPDGQHLYTYRGHRDDQP